MIRTKVRTTGTLGTGVGSTGVQRLTTMSRSPADSPIGKYKILPGWGGVRFNTHYP